MLDRYSDLANRPDRLYQFMFGTCVLEAYSRLPYIWQLLSGKSIAEHAGVSVYRIPALQP
jgi:hypothetical protein